MNENIDKLIFGKAGLKRIVGIECSDSSAEIFIQQEDGSVKSQFVPHRYWILASEKLDSKFVRLEGDLHYCWGKQCDNRSDWSKQRNIFRNEDIYSIWNAEEAMMVKDGYTFYQDLKLPEVSLLSWDIETTGLHGDALDAKVLLISTTYRDIHGQYNKLFAYDDYESEGEMIEAFGEYIRQKDPSIIIGHNIMGYDFKYMRHRADDCGVSLSWGRDGSEIEFDDYESKFRLDGSRDLTYNKVKIYGREICDTFFLAYSYDVSKSFEQYGLKPLIKQLGFEKDGRQHYDAGTIKDNYLNPTEWAKIKKYAEDDAEDAVKLFDLMSPLFFNMAQMFPKPFSEILLSASGSKINSMLCRAYLQERHSLPKADETRKFQGALSWGRPGVYKNVKKVDAVSLYPSIILQYSVYDADKDPKAYLLELVKIFRAKRLECKKMATETGDKYWQDLDTTQKSILNSFFGFFGCPGLNFNSYDCAEFITSTGRQILETAIKWATSKTFQEIAPDYYEEDEDNEEE